MGDRKSGPIAHPPIASGSAAVIAMMERAIDERVMFGRPTTRASFSKLETIVCLGEANPAAASSRQNTAKMGALSHPKIVWALHIT